jgi:flagellar hook-basal body complex protein FliE
MDRIRGISDAPAFADLTPAERPGGASFAEALGKAIASTDAYQAAGDGEVERLALGAGNLHETSLALEKADTAMRVLMKVRNKVVDAYQEIMRMSV